MHFGLFVISLSSFLVGLCLYISVVLIFFRILLVLFHEMALEDRRFFHLPLYLYFFLIFVFFSIVFLRHILLPLFCNIAIWVLLHFLLCLSDLCHRRILCGLCVWILAVLLPH